MYQILNFQLHLYRFVLFPLTLSNGSVIQLLGADNPDKLVGINPLGIVFSEYSLADPVAWELTRPILAENGGWALFNGTPRGQNHFYTLLKEAEADKDWFASHLPVTKTRAIPAETLRKERGKMSEARFQSEYMCSFNTPVEGAYYGGIITKLYQKEQILQRLPPEPSLPVHTAWDLGMDDATSIWFFQQHRYAQPLGCCLVTVPVVQHPGRQPVPLEIQLPHDRSPAASPAHDMDPAGAARRAFFPHEPDIGRPGHFIGIHVDLAVEYRVDIFAGNYLVYRPGSHHGPVL